MASDEGCFFCAKGIPVVLPDKREVRVRDLRTGEYKIWRMSQRQYDWIMRQIERKKKERDGQEGESVD